jgi:hypothetical protein
MFGGYNQGETHEKHGFDRDSEFERNEKDNKNAGEHQKEGQTVSQRGFHPDKLLNHPRDN